MKKSTGARDIIRAETAARAFLHQHFPNCLAAFLAGSAIRGEATPTSDLDIVILTEQENAPYRESFEDYGWLIEAFVHTTSSYKDFFASDVKRRRPSLPSMCAEGLILKDTNGLAEEAKKEAQDLLRAGPPPLSQEDLDASRYALTDVLDDFIGAQSHAKALFVAADLINLTAESILDVNNHWRGRGKWNLRRLREGDGDLAEQFVTALDIFYKREDRALFVTFVETMLAAHGGRLFAGYSAGKQQ